MVFENENPVQVEEDVDVEATKAIKNTKFIVDLTLFFLALNELIIWQNARKAYFSGHETFIADLKKHMVQKFTGFVVFDTWLPGILETNRTKKQLII